MIDKAFELAVVISAIDSFTGPARAMATQMGILSKQSETVQQKMKGFKAMALTGGAVTLVGAGLAKGIFDAVEAAGNLQTSMMAVKESMGLTNAELKKMTDLSMTIGIPTIFSSEQVGGIMQAMSTAGLSKKQVMDPNIARQYVNFADVQAQIKHEDGADVVSTAVTMAHQFQLYSTAQITPFLNNLNAALEHTHDTASEFATTYKYISNQARSQGMNANDTLSTTAWLGRMGFGSGKGGTNFADFLQRSIYHSSGAKADGAMEQAGFVKDGRSVFSDKQGNFVGIPDAVKIMQDFGKRFNNNANLIDPLLHAIFGTQGARVAQMMTSQGASEQYTNVRQQMAGSEATDQTQEDLNNTWQGKIKQFQTTIKDIQQAFGQSVMPQLMPILKVFDDILGRVLLFEQSHPKIMAYIATFLSIAAAAGLVIGPLLILVGALGYLSASGIMGAGFSILSRSLLGMLGPVALIATAAFLLYKAWTTDWGGIREKTAGVINWVKAEFPHIEALIMSVAKALGFITNTGQFQLPSWLIWTAGILLGVKGMTGMLGAVTSILGPFASLTRFIGSGSSILTGLITFGSWLLRITGITKLWAAAQGLLNVVMSMNPIGLIIIGVAALIGLIVLMITHWKTVVTWLSEAWNWFKNLGIGVQAVIVILSGFILLPALIIAHWKEISTFFVSLWKDAESWGGNLITGFMKGITGMGAWFKNNILKWVDDHIPGPIKKVLGINSPSTLMAQYGAFTAQGLAKGMIDNSNLVKNAAHHLSAAASGDQSDSFYSDTMGRVGGNGSTTVHIHEGAIQITGASEHQAGDIVDEVFRRLGTKTRMSNMSLPFGPNRFVPN